MRFLIPILLWASAAYAQSPELAATVRLTQYKADGVSCSMGTGVAVLNTPQRTLIATAAHVFAKDHTRRITVETGNPNSPTTYEARLADWYDDGEHDAALLIIEGQTTIRAATIDGYNKPAPGQPCVWVGSALGVWPREHAGQIIKDAGDLIAVLPPCESGDSGGPVFVNGKLVGLCLGHYPPVSDPNNKELLRGIYHRASDIDRLLTAEEAKPHGLTPRKNGQ